MSASLPIVAYLHVAPVRRFVLWPVRSFVL